MPDHEYLQNSHHGINDDSNRKCLGKRSILVKLLVDISLFAIENPNFYFG